jgi:predicted PurR-regulated permease PerM
MDSALQRAGETRSSNLADQRRLVVAITPRTVWLAVGLLALLAAVAVVLMKALFVFILIFIAIILAEGIRPAVEWQARHHVPRPLAVLLIYLGVAVVAAILVYILISPLLSQLTTLNRELPRYVQQVQSFFTRARQVISSSPELSRALDSLQASQGSLIGTLASLLLQIPYMIGTILFSSVVVAVMAFFWLTGIEHLKPFVVSLFPEERRAAALSVLAEMGEHIGGYVRGVVINMWVIGILSGVADWLLGIPYPVLLGILAGLTELIPYFGPWISGGVAALVALITLGPLAALEVVGVYVIIQEIEGHTLIPVVMMREVNLNPLTVVIAVLLGAELLGVIGGILAVPAAAVVKVLIVRVAAPAARHASARLSLPHDGYDAASSPTVGSPET